MTSEPQETSSTEQPPLKPGDEHRIAFHMAEFSALKSEIAELVKVASSNLQYALAVSGAITAWLVSAKVPLPTEQSLLKVDQSDLRIAFFLPLLLSIIFGFAALASYIRIHQKGAYLQEIESRLRAEGLGWERHLKTKFSSLGVFYGLAWIGLLAFNLFVASYGLKC